MTFARCLPLKNRGTEGGSEGKKKPGIIHIEYIHIFDKQDLQRGQELDGRGTF